MSSFNEQPNLQPGQEPENAAAPAAGESVTPRPGRRLKKIWRPKRPNPKIYRKKRR